MRAYPLSQSLAVSEDKLFHVVKRRLFSKKIIIYVITLTLVTTGYITIHVVPMKHFFKISSNFEANASELLENLEEMFFYDSSY